MSISLSQVNTAVGADTWQNLVDKLNAVINTVANSIVTANTNANGATTTGNAFVVGIFGGNTFVVYNAIRGGNVQSSANLTITSNAIFTGSIITLGANITLNNSSLAIGANVVLSDSVLSYGNSTANVVVNSTAIAISSNALLTGVGLAVGNSTVNVVVNTAGVSVSGAALPLSNNKSEVAVNGTLIGNARRINFSGSGAANVSATLDSGGGQINVVVDSIVTLLGGTGGTNTDVLFNDSTNVGGSGGFTFDKSTNNVFIANTLTVSTVSSTIFFAGNSTTNAVGNSTAHVYSNSTAAITFGLIGFTIGANVSGNVTAIQAGGTVINSSGVSGANVVFTNQIVGGNVNIDQNRVLFGNSTVNVVANSTSVTISTAGGTVTLNSTAVLVGGNVTVNTSSFSLGNSTISWTGNSSQIQLANSSVATIANSQGVAIGANVTLTFQALTVGNTTINSTSFGLGNSTVNVSINSTSFSGTANNSTNLGGVGVAQYLTLSGGKTITGGFAMTPVNLGVTGSFTANVLLHNYQYYTCNSAITITAPTTDGAVDFLQTNGSAAGTVTFSGFTVGPSTGDALTTTNGSKFMISVRRIGGTATYMIKALQ